MNLSHKCKKYHEHEEWITCIYFISNIWMSAVSSMYFCYEWTVSSSLLQPSPICCDEYECIIYVTMTTATLLMLILFMNSVFSSISYSINNNRICCVHFWDIKFHCVFPLFSRLNVDRVKDWWIHIGWHAGKVRLKNVKRYHGLLKLSRCFWKHCRRDSRVTRFGENRKNRQNSKHMHPQTKEADEEEEEGTSFLDWEISSKKFNPIIMNITFILYDDL